MLGALLRQIEQWQLPAPLHLLGHAPTDARGQPAAAAGSLLRILWPVVGERFASTPPTPPNAEPASPAAPAPLRRLPVDYALPAAPPSPPRPPERAAVAATADTDEPPYEWAGTGIRRVGTVVHRLLQAIAESGAADWNEQRVRDSGPLIDRLLRDAAVDAGQSGRARSRVQQALVNTLRDRTGRWILDPTHPAAECERRVSGRLDGRVVHAVLDRTLIDGEGRRWIIDYKSSDHRGADLEGFLLEQRQRYAAQLETYARLLAAEEPGRPISLMLYFPLLGRHVAWPFAPARPAGAD